MNRSEAGGPMAAIDEIGWPAIEIEVQMGSGASVAPAWGIRISPEQAGHLIKTLGRSELAWGGSEIDWALAREQTRAGPAAAFRGLMDLLQALAEQCAGHARLEGSCDGDSLGFARDRAWRPEGRLEREALTARLRLRARVPFSAPKDKVWRQRAAEDLMGSLDAAFERLGVAPSKTLGAPKGRPPKAPAAEETTPQGGCCYLELEGEWLASWVRPESWERAKKENPWARALGQNEWAAAVAFRCSAGLSELTSPRSWSFSNMDKKSWALSGVGCAWECPPEEYKRRLEEFFGEGSVSEPERVIKTSQDEYARQELRDWAQRATQAYPARAEAEVLAKQLGEESLSRRGPKGL